MDLRPDWCPDEKSLWLNGFAGRLCVSRMPKMKEHPDSRLFNTHYFCTEDNCLEINLADAVFIAECMISVLKDGIKNNLYNPCLEAGISGDPVQRLIGLLQAIKPAATGPTPE